MTIKKCKLRLVKLLIVGDFLYWKLSLKEASEFFSSNKDILAIVPKGTKGGR